MKEVLGSDSSPNHSNTMKKSSNLLDHKYHYYFENEVPAYYLSNMLKNIVI